MSNIITFIIVNAVLAGSVVLAMLWLLGHHGIRKGIEHDLAIIRRRAVSIEQRVERDIAA